VPNIELMAGSAWYAPDDPASFLIVDKGDVDTQTALETFGAPDHIHQVGAFQVFTWDKGISCTLPLQTPEVRAQRRRTRQLVAVGSDPNRFPPPARHIACGRV